MRNNNQILQTKLHRPPVNGDHVHRARLIDKLNNNYQKSVLTLVSAPAGYGKSHLVSSWVSKLSVPYGWISLDEKDNDLHTFLKYFTTSLESVFPGTMKKELQLLNSSKVPAVSEFSDRIINGLDKIETDFVLVLDDYHEIHNKEIHSFINKLIHYPPDRFHLCIATRKDPQLHIGSLRAYNRMFEVRMKDLAFDMSEISIFYRNLLGFEINEKTAEELFKRTEGWITGLRFTILSVSTPEELNNLLFKLKGDMLFVTEYLVEEVLSAQPQWIQDALINSSVLEKFNAEVLNVLNSASGSKNSKTFNGSDFLKWLESTNLFLVSLDYEHKWYRYHFLFRELLLKQFKNRKTLSQINAIHKKMSKWFEANGFVEKAIKHAMLSGEGETAVKIVERNRFLAINKDNWNELEKWLSLLPGNLISNNTAIQLCIAWVGKAIDEKSTLTKSLLYCFNMLAKDPQKDLIYGEFNSIYGYEKFMIEGDPKGALELINEALAVIPEDSTDMLRAETEHHYVILTYTLGNYKEAYEYVHSRLIMLNGNYSKLLERLQLAMCSVFLLNGDLLNLHKDALKLKEIAENNNSLFAEVWSSWFLGAAAFYRFELEEAMEHFIRVSELRYTFPGRMVLDAMCSLAVTYQMMNNKKKADEILSMVEEYANRTHDKSKAIALTRLKARLALIRGDVDEAVLYERQVSNVINALPGMYFYLNNGPVICCNVNTAEGTKESMAIAKELVDNIYDVTKRFNQPAKTMNILITRSILERKSGKAAESLRSMQKAVEFAELNGLVQPFIEYGTDAIPIIEELSKKDKSRVYCRKLISLYNKYLKNNSGAAADQNVSQKLTEPISQREQEILQLLSHGYKNKEIGDKLFLAPTTIKKHVYNLYQKLDVHTRFEVISKAKEVGLI